MTAPNSGLPVSPSKPLVCAPSPACWGRWRAAPDGVWSAASTEVGLHDRHREFPATIHTCFLHPIRRRAAPSPLRGEGRRDGGCGRTKGCSGGGGRCALIVGVVEGLVSQHGAGHGVHGSCHAGADQHSASCFPDRSASPRGPSDRRPRADAGCRPSGATRGAPCRSGG